MMFDFHYLLFMLPALILSLIATWITRSTFEKYSRYPASSGMTGAEAAQRLLDRLNIHTVKIEAASGFLSDHYDPLSHTLRLSPGVYGSNSLSAIGVACHEAGHAIQQATRFAPLALRSALVPATQVGSNASYFFLLLGILFNIQALLMVGILLFTVVVVFSLVTLPVEWDASNRAKQLMVSTGIVSAREEEDASRVLNAAFMTYVAAAVSAVLTLIYYLLKSGLLGRRND